MTATAAEPPSGNINWGSDAPQYGGDLKTAMDAVISENPDVANLLNIEVGGRVNARIFLKLVETKLKSMGFNATVEVLNGNDNPSTGDMIALWRTGDNMMERYDAIIGNDTNPKTIAESLQQTFTGLITLDCTASGGGKGCKYDDGTNNTPGGNGGAPFPVQPVAMPPTQGLPTDLGQLIQQIFTWSLGILGISVFVMFFYSGFLYLTAAGNTARTGEAKTHMTNAIFGAILLLSAYLILYTINPDFVKSTVNLPGLGDLK